MELKVENRSLVVPGELIATGDALLGEGAYKTNEEVRSKILGLVDINEQFVKIIPLSGKYVPKAGDLVVGIVSDIAFSSWYVDLNSPHSGVLTVANGTERFIDLNTEDISKIYGIGEVIAAKVDNVGCSMVVGLTMKDRGLSKLGEGRLIEISPTKVPRVIGKKGTMVQLLKDYTDARITVGQNGRVWISGGNEALAIEAIRKIESEAHVPGLTDKIKAFLEEKSGKKGTQVTIRPISEMDDQAFAPVVEAAPAESVLVPTHNDIVISPAPVEESTQTSEVNPNG